MPGRQSRNVLMRRVSAGAAAFAGLFASCYGLGSGRQAILLVGAALLLVAGGTRLLSGGFRRTPRQWLRGTGRVVEVSEPPLDFRFGRCTLRLEIDAPGLVGEPVTVHDSRVPVEQWPRPGQELPVQVAADDIRKVRVLWREAHSSAAVADTPPVWREETAGATANTPDDTPTVRFAAPPEAVDFDIDNPPGPLIPGDSASPDWSPRNAAPSEENFAASSAAVSSAASPVESTVESPVETSTESPVSSSAESPDTSETDTESEPSDKQMSRTLPRPRPSPHPRSTATTGGFSGVGITVLVSDLSRSVAFYRDMLGFQEVDGGEDATVLASGATRLVLRQAPDLGAVKLRLVHLNLEVGDIDATYEELKAGGVRFTYPPRATNQTARLEQWAAAFRDPDGHGVAITQWRPRQEVPATS